MQIYFYESAIFFSSQDHRYLPIVTWKNVKDPIRFTSKQNRITPYIKKNMKWIRWKRFKSRNYFLSILLRPIAIHHIHRFLLRYIRMSNLCKCTFNKKKKHRWEKHFFSNLQATYLRIQKDLWGAIEFIPEFMC